MDKITDFPHDIQPGTDLNGDPPQGSPQSDPPQESAPAAKPAKKPLIDEIGEYLKSICELRYNVVKNEIEYKLKSGGGWQDCDERAALRFEAELLRAGHKGVARTLAVYLANVPEYDPIEDYLKNLSKWDGVDHIGALCKYVEMPEKRRAWFEIMLKKHLVRMLACATGKSDFNKQIFTFVSGQNDGKTSLIRFLCPDPWKAYFSEEIDFESKDGLIALARNVFLVLDELRGMSRADINKIKSMTSKDHVKARLPFDRRETRLRRHASFWASTNNSEFLTDETGSVRWSVHEITGIRHDNGGKAGYNQNIDINKVYAQAYHLLNDPNFQYNLTTDEIKKSESFNQAHTKNSSEFEAIVLHFEPGEKSDFMMATTLKKTLESEPYFYKITSVEAVGKALRQMNIERVKRRWDGRNVYGYLLRKRAGGDWLDADADGEE